MTTLKIWVWSVVNAYCQRRRFPQSVIHSGAIVDKTSMLREYSVLFRNAVLHNSCLGAYSYVQSSSMVVNADIGPFCSIAGSVNIGLAAHPTNMVSTSPVCYDNTQPLPKFFVNKRHFADNIPRTTIGADVWIGYGALLKAGVNVGVGAVIGAGSVVTKDIPPYVVAAGNPCRPLKSRFPDELKDRLLKSRWWELSEERLAEFAEVFPYPELFVAALEKVD